MNYRRIYIDCDGVLADFDEGFNLAIGMPPREYEEKVGAKQFWERIAKIPDFYANLPLVPGAMDLMDFLRPHRPIILTGLPLGTWAANQKLVWRDRYFPEIVMAPCLGKNKHLFCELGDILIDDWDRYREKWQKEGGKFVLHEKANYTIDTLRRLL